MFNGAAAAAVAELCEGKQTNCACARTSEPVYTSLVFACASQKAKTCALRGHTTDKRRARECNLISLNQSLVRRQQQQQQQRHWLNY